MSDSVLAIDFGTAWTAVSVVRLDGRAVRLQAPDARDGAVSVAWPSAVHLGADRRATVGNAAERARRADPERYHAGFRRELGEEGSTATELTATFLRALRERAESVEGRGAITQAVITVPGGGGGPGNPHRERLLIAAAQAGFEQVDLIDEVLAAAMQPPDEGRYAPGDTVLVYSLGAGFFDAVLVRYGEPGEPPAVLATAPALEDCAGREVDLAVARWLRSRGGGHGDEADLLKREEQVRFERLCTALKHDLSGLAVGQAVTETLGEGRSYTLSVEDFVQHCAGPLIDRTVKHCQELVDGARARAELRGVLLVGGSTFLNLVEQRLWGEFAKPFGRSQARTDAALHGAELFAARAAERVAAALPWDAAERPLRWSLPGGAGELMRWHVQPGARYPAGAELASVRLDDGSVLALRAAESGRVLARHADPGHRVHDRQWLLSSALPFRPWSLALPPLLGGPAVLPEAGTVAVCAKAGRLYALVDATGERRWHRDLPAPPHAGPVAAPGVLLVATEAGTLHGLDPATGRDLWRPYTCGVQAAAPVAVGDGHVVLATRDNRLHVLRAADGTPLAEPAQLPGPVQAVTASAAGPCYARLVDGQLFAHDLGGGIRQLAEPLLTVGQPLACADGVYCCFRDGSLRLLDGVTGNLRWRHAHGAQQGGLGGLGGGRLRPAAPWLLTETVPAGEDPAPERPAVLLRLPSGWLLTLDPNSGRELLRSQLAPGARLKDLRSHGGVLFVATADELTTTAKDPEAVPRGSLWRLDLRPVGELRAPVAVADEAVYAVVGDALYALPALDPAPPARPRDQLALR